MEFGDDSVVYFETSWGTIDVSAVINQASDSSEGGLESMTQAERRQTLYDEVVEFIQTNHRNPSKYVDARPQKLGQAAKEAHERMSAGRSTLKDVQ